MSLRVTSIEIGTSDFDLEDAGVNDTVILVEPVISHLRRAEKQVRDRGAQVLGICAIVDTSVNAETNKSLPIFYVDPADCDKYNFPQWLRGCSMVSQIHPETRQFLMEYFKKTGIQVPVHKKSIEVLSFTDVLRRATAEFGQISEIGTLKYDTEGMDTDLVRSALREIEALPGVAPAGELVSVFPQKLIFEGNWLSSAEAIDKAVADWEHAGYSCTGRGQNVVLERF